MMASQAGRSGSSGESSSWRVFSSRPLANEAWTGFCGQIWRWGAATGTEQGGGGQFDGRGDDPGPTAGSSSLFPSFSNMMLTARELVLLYRDMLAVPLMDACPPKLWLIFARDPERHGYPSPLLPGARPMQERIVSLGLFCCQSRVHISPEIFEQCLQFTVQTRMAPSWNRIGPYFLAGTNFLEMATVNYIVARLSFLATTSEVVLALKAGRLRFPSLTLKDYTIQKRVLEQFQKGEVQCITSASMGLGSVHVLPNLTQGQIVSITKHHLKSGEIDDWKDMRRYWKNMYGIRMREEREPEFFVNVKFGAKRSQIFSYPDLCVRPFHPYCIPRINPQPIIDQFLVDFRERMPTVCGEPLQIPVSPIPRSVKNRARLQASGDQAPVVDVKQSQSEARETINPGLSCPASQFKMTIPASFKSPQWKEAHPKQIFGSQSSFIPPHQSKGNNPAPFKKSAKFDELFKPASSRAVYDDNDGSGDHSSPKNGSAFSLASGSILDKFLKNSKSVQVGPEPQLKVAESAMSQVVRSKSVKRSAVKSDHEGNCPDKKFRMSETSMMIEDWLQQRNLKPDAFGDKFSQESTKEELELSPNLLNEIFETSLNEP